MQDRSLGTTELEVTPVGFGTVELGMPYEVGLPPPPSTAASIALLRRAYEAGINYFDTAPVYGNSEELVGKAFSHLREKPILATKVTLKADAKGPHLAGAALRQHLETSVLNSLEKLELERIELLQIHSVEENFATEELLDIADDFCSRGLVRYWGATTYGKTAPMEALDYAEHFRVLQVAYNVLDRRMEKQVFPRSRQVGTGVVLRSAFLKGALSERVDRLPAHLAPLSKATRRVQQLAEGMGISLPELAFRFTAHNPYSSIALFGTASAVEMQANLEAFFAGPLPEEVQRELEPLSLDDTDLINPGTWGF